jgi:hypothetical protein
MPAAAETHVARKAASPVPQIVIGRLNAVLAARQLLFKLNNVTCLVLLTCITHQRVKPSKPIHPVCCPVSRVANPGIRHNLLASLLIRLFLGLHDALRLTLLGLSAWHRKFGRTNRCCLLCCNTHCFCCTCCCSYCNGAAGNWCSWGIIESAITYVASTPVGHYQVLHVQQDSLFYKSFDL